MTNSKKIIGKACKFASTHTVNKHRDNGRYRDDRDDILVVKEEIFYDDGTSEPNMRVVENAERPFWIVKEAFRKFKTKREWMPIDQCDQYWSTESQLNDSIARALKRRPDPRGNLRVTNRDPYVMGTDITSGVWTRIQYKQKYPEYHAYPNKVAVYDIETDVIGRYALAQEEHGDAIIGATIAMGKKVRTVCLRDFVERQTKTPEEHFFHVLDRDMPDLRKDKKFDVEFIMVDTELDIIKTIFHYAHRWQPDIIGCWNMVFDVKVTAERIQAWGEDPADYFCDPRIPKKYRKYFFKEDIGNKESASGRKLNKMFYQLWHTVMAPASFTWLDAACSYWFIRSHKGNLPSGALDVILKKEINRGKFDIDEAEGYKGLDKHILMQETYPVEYMVYNAYDCIGILEMEEKNRDMTAVLPALLGVSEYSQFSSSPKKVMNNFAEFEIYKRGNVPGCTSDQMRDENDRYVVPEKNWIVALPTNCLDDGGMKLIEELPNTASKVYIMCADLDVKSSYPRSIINMNISRDTTSMELVSIEGVSLPQRYAVGLNMMAGKTNAVSYCRTVHKTPDLFELRDIYRKQKSSSSKLMQ